MSEQVPFVPKNSGVFKLIRRHFPSFKWEVETELPLNGGNPRHRVVFRNYPTIGASTDPPRAGQNVPLEELKAHFKSLEEEGKPTLYLDPPEVQEEALRLCERRRAEARRRKRENRSQSGRAKRLAGGF